MAKKDKKKGKKKDNPRPDAVGAVRTAVERTFHATADSAQSTRTRAQDLVDEVAGAAGRLREMIEQIGVLEDLKKQVDALTSRVAALERVGGDTRAKASGTSTRAKRSGGTTRAKAKSSGGTSKASGGTTRAKRSGGTSRAKAKSSGGTSKASGGTSKASGGTTRAKRSSSSSRAKSSGSTRAAAKKPSSS